MILIFILTLVAKKKSRSIAFKSPVAITILFAESSSNATTTDVKIRCKLDITLLSESHRVLIILRRTKSGSSKLYSIILR